MTKGDILKKLNDAKAQGANVLPYHPDMSRTELERILRAIVVLKYRLKPRYFNKVIFRQGSSTILRNDLSEELLKTLYEEGHTDKIERYT